jgi:hypothetical protein
MVAVWNTAADAEQIYAPGSILRVLVDGKHPVGRGMSDSAAIYFVNSTSLELPAGSNARVIARYRSQADAILMSGFLQGYWAAFASNELASRILTKQEKVAPHGSRSHLIRSIVPC